MATKHLNTNTNPQQQPQTLPKNKQAAQPVIPAKWNKEAHVAWLAGDKMLAIQTVVTDVNQYKTNKPEDKVLQLAYYLYLIGDYPSAALVLKPLAENTKNAEVLLNLAVCYRRIGESENAVTYAKKTLALSPKNVVAYDVLATSYHMLRQFDLAAEAGTQALLLKDELTTKTNPAWHLPKTRPKEFISTPAPKTNVIAFSLWGDNPRYLRGALRNLLLAKDMYPQWVLRFYVDNSVPQAFIELAKSLNADIQQMPDNQSTKDKLCWRFLVANDASVGYFLVRDIDSSFSVREVNAVNTWLQSDKWFHVMRDWWSHTDLVLAGMWGGIAGILPNIKQLLSQYQPKQMETPNIDQWFLRDILWAYIRQSCLIHDRCFNMPNTVKLEPPVNEVHIGQNEFVDKDQALILSAWIDKYPFLQTK